MRFPSECRQIHRTLRQTMPNLTEAQSKGLALWALGTITAQSGRRNAVIAALTFTGGFSDVRRRLPRMALRRGRPLHAVPKSDRRPRPLSRRLMRWVLSLWSIGNAPSRSLGASCPPTNRASG